MNRSDWLTDELITAAFEQRAQRADPGALGKDILSLTAATSQGAAWRLRLTNSLAAPTLRPVWIALVLLGVLIGAVLALALVGQHPHRVQPGLLAYSRDGDVYLANADGSAIRVVHDAGVVFSAPTWSPDGRWLAIEGSGGEFLLDPGTLQLRRIATGHDAVWASDGQSLALLTSAASGADANVIDIVRIATGALHELQPKVDSAGSLRGPLAWSPDGRWFLALANGRLTRIDATTGDTVEIAPMYHLTEPGAHWSPDSRWFAYARPENCGTPPCRTTVVVERVDLSQAVPITDPATLSKSPIWSPDGAWIAFTTLQRSAQGPGQSKLVPTLSIIRPDGQDLRALAQTAAQAWSWRADGTAVDFTNNISSAGSPVGVFEVRISDGVVRSAVLALGVDGYDWQAIAAEGPLPTLPAPASPESSLAKPNAPLPAPPSAPPADPSGSWSGIAVDADCGAGVLSFRTLTIRIVGSVCPNAGGAVFAPRGLAYALPGQDGSLVIVRRDGSKAKPLGAIAATDLVQLELLWSPDGRWLSVHRCIQSPTGPCIDSENLVVSLDGRSIRRLPATPSWSPDGRRLVVMALNGDLLMGSPDGSDLRSIGAFPMPISWSPDATQFAFVRDGNAWIANADGTGQRNASQFASGGVYDAAWSPDGRFIAVTQESQLSILRLAGGDPLPIDLGPGRTSFYGPAVWSPDSARLAVVVGPGETPATLIVRTEDWTANALAGDDIESVAWSPDGRFIALLGFSAGVIDIANSDGSGRHPVRSSSDYGSRRITWVP